MTEVKPGSERGLTCIAVHSPLARQDAPGWAARNKARVNERKEAGEAGPHGEHTVFCPAWCCTPTSMISAIQRRLSYANVAATLALVFSMSGSALAAKHYLINSPKQISPKVLNKLKGQNGKSGPTGAIGAIGPKGETGPRGAQGEKGAPGASATALWAVVNSAGTLVRGSGATAATLLAATTSFYEVTFNRNVSACSYEATVGGVNFEEALPVGGTTIVFPGFEEPGPGVEVEAPTKVDVITFSKENTRSARPFHLAVFC
jgi:hypothetical protein